jgi:hypothetical protein
MVQEGEVRPRRMTVATLVERFGVRADADAAEVTLTSIVRQAGDARPGALFVPGSKERTRQACRAAVLNGAYAVLVPSGRQSKDLAQIGVPLLTARDPQTVIGPAAAYLNGDPSKAIAVFTVLGPDCDVIADRLGRILHHLGNPIGFVGAQGAYSLGRQLDTHGVLDAARLQFLEAVMTEDGVTALVIAASRRCLQPQALSGTQIDVLYDPQDQDQTGRSGSGPDHSDAPIHRTSVDSTDDAQATAGDGQKKDTASGAAIDDTAVIDARTAATGAGDLQAHGPVFGAVLPAAACISTSPVAADDPRFAELEGVLDLTDASTAAAVRLAVDAGISVGAIARAERVAREFEPDTEPDAAEEQSAAQQQDGQSGQQE